MFRIKKVEGLKIVFAMHAKRLALWLSIGVLPLAASAFEVKVQGVSGGVLTNVEALLAPVKQNSFTEVRQTYRSS